MDGINRKALTAAIILGAIAIFFSMLMVNNAYFPGDLAVTQFWQSLASGLLTAFMKIVAYLFGSWRAAALTLICMGLLTWKMGKAEAIMAATAGLLTLSNYGFKALVGRPRPAVDLVQVLAHETSNSFPSSHAFFAMLLIGTLIYLLNRRMPNNGQHLAVSATLGLVIVVVGITRVYLGVHWYSDVLAGYIFGGFFLSLLIMGYERFKKPESTKPVPPLVFPSRLTH